MLYIFREKNSLFGFEPNFNFVINEYRGAPVRVLPNQEGGEEIPATEEDNVDKYVIIAFHHF